MKLICTWLAALITAAAFASSAAQPNLDLKTTINVDSATPRDVFESMSKILGCKLVIAPEITQPVTMRLQNVTVRTALTALSESLGCRWGIRKAQPCRHTRAECSQREPASSHARNISIRAQPKAGLAPSRQ